MRIKPAILGIAVAITFSSGARGQFITKFSIPSGHWVYDITAGRDGNLWFAQRSTEKRTIGQVAVDGTIQQFELPPDFRCPEDITARPDGNLWLARGESLGKLTPGGDLIDEYVVAEEDIVADSTITAGPG